MTGTGTGRTGRNGDGRRPNILLLMADQHRGDAIGAARAAAGEAEPALQTPHLDRLCREGVRFARAYTESPVCVSARATILTGRLPHRTGVVDNGYTLEAGGQTLPRLLAARGYHCQAIGKMHFSPVREHHGLHRLWLSEEIPRVPAEDEFLTHLLEAGFSHVEEPHGIRHEMYYVPQVSQLPEAHHTTAWTGRRTVEYLEEHTRERSDQPFFCWSSFIKPHPPFDPPVPWHTLYRPTDEPLGAPIRTEDEALRHTYYHRTQNRFKWTDHQPDANLLRIMRAYYAACVSFIDHWVGQILDTLERLDLRRDTLVLFVADHGEYLGDHYAFGKRGYHDPACRIPFIASWPGRLPAGQVRHQLVGLSDVLPTCIDAADSGSAGEGAVAAGGDASAPVIEEVDGASVLPWARDGDGGTRGRGGREALIGQLAEKAKGLYAVIEPEWKYVYSAPDDREYLMRRGEGEGPECDRNECDDYAQDPQHAGVLERLRGLLVERFRRDGYVDPLDERDPAGLRRWPSPGLPWAPLDEMENRSTVARGWQYASWNRRAPYDTSAHDLRLDPAKGAYAFPARDVRVPAAAKPAGRGTQPDLPAKPG